MIFRNAFVFGVLSSVLLPGLAHAANCQVAILASVTLCKRCTIEVNASTKRDTECIGNVTIGYGTGNSSVLSGGIAGTILGGNVAKSAKHGKFTAQSTSFTYAPAKGFVGRDDFTMERDYLVQEQVYVVYYHITMEVAP